MENNYYYIISGLPDLLLDEGKKFISFVEFCHDIYPQLDSNDAALIDVIRLQFDNVNLITVMENSDREFDKRGTLSREDLVNGLKNPDLLPGYMQQYMESVRENRPLFPLLVKEDQLNWLYYEWLSEHPVEFIREWFGFEQNLRNLIIGITTRKNIEHIIQIGTEREKPSAFMLVGQNETADAVVKSTAPDFGISSIGSWVEKVIVLSQGSALDFEKGVDLIRWEMLDELTMLSYFSIEKILVFALKLAIVERWEKLDEKIGRARLDRLTEDLSHQFTIPEEFR